MGMRGWTALHLAARIGVWDIVQVMLEMAPEPHALRNVVSTEGQLPYDIAFAAGHTALLPCLDPGVRA